MSPLDSEISGPVVRRSEVERAVTGLESGLITALVGLVLLFTMTDAAAILPALSFVSGQ